MKRNLLLLLLSFLTVPLLADRVDPETARKVASTFLNNNGAKATQLTDLSKPAGFPNLYIFNAEQGFVVMSADDRVKPILGYSLTGEFVVEDMPENVSSWLQAYNDGIQHAINNGTKSNASVDQAWKDLANGRKDTQLATPVVDALVKTQWNQGSPYNNSCPKVGSKRTVTGCVATAMAQVMKYWNHPVTGTESHSYSWNNQILSADFNSTTYDWSHMTDTYNSSSSSTAKTAVATLMFHCGVSIEMDYGTSASSASTYAVMSALQTYFSYAPCMQYKSKDDYDDEVWITMLKRELDEKRPLQYRGSDADGNGGHSFVCDGYDSDDNFHFNWGWGGFCDGFYSVDDMEPGTGGIGAGNGVYTVGESAIFGIEPLSSLNAPALSAATNQCIVTLTWNAISEAVSYEVYKDNEKIGTVTETNYVDSEITFGVEYEYYVRAVSDDERSNPSNHVILKSLYRDITPSNLTATLDDSNVSFTWSGYSGGLSTDLHYGMNISDYVYGTSSSNDAYWGHRYPIAYLSQLKGMYITKVTSYLYYAGSYTMYLFSGNLDDNNRTKLAEITISKASTGLEWIDFNLGTPVAIDCTKDLWAVLYTSKDIQHPILFEDNYTGENANDAKFISSTLESLFTSGSIDSGDISWIIRTYITDGTYTYNLYDGDTKLNGDTPIPNTSYTISDIGNGLHQFTVRTSYYGGESEASNEANINIGNNKLGTLTLSENSQMIVAPNSTLTVTGTITNDDPDNLIIEDGGQLISDAVNGTMKKEIDAYDTGVSNHWRLITSPVSNADVSLATLGSYDLYAYDESENYWRNQKVTANSITNFVSGQGYLYANAEDKTLLFAGELNGAYNGIDLSFAANGNIKGYNLVGNPRAYDNDLWIVDGHNDVVSNINYALLNTDGDGFVYATTGSDGIIHAKPLQGFFVQATASGQRLVDATTNSSRSHAEEKVGNGDNGFINLMLFGNGKQIDNAIVRLGEGYNLGKITFFEGSSKLYIPLDHKEYAIAVSDKQGEIPINFKAAENGTYTITVDTENADLEYLHLIDNITGTHIDLSATPSYRFEARTDDYPSRFRLLFSTPQNEMTLDYGEFAFYANGQIIVPNMDENARLHIIDMTGRVINDTHITTPGVYILQLITENETKTQKIVVR